MTVLRNIDISKSKKIENCRHYRTARNMKMKIDDFFGFVSDYFHFGSEQSKKSKQNSIKIKFFYASNRQSSDMTSFQDQTRKM